MIIYKSGFHRLWTADHLMGNLLHNRRRSSGATKIRHDGTFPLLTSHRGKDRVQFSTGFIQKKTLSITGVMQIFHTKNR
jgi:hypothetical protein